MQFLIDADLPRDLVSLCIAAGHHAVHAAEVSLGTASDDSIAEFAKRTRRCILTGDFDFSDVRAFPPHEYHGIVVLVIPRGVGGSYIRALTIEFLETNGRSDLTGKLLIVEPGRIRVRS